MLARDADGVIEVLASSDERVEIAIWNPDGSRAELSGNGTRIAAAWLTARSGAEQMEVVVGERSVITHILDDGVIEQDLGEVTVAPSETIAGFSVTPVSVGNPHAVVLGDPDTIVDIGPLLETSSRFPDRTNVQVARIDGPGEVTARVWERGSGGDRLVRNERCRRRCGDPRRGRGRRTVPRWGSARAPRERAGVALRLRRAPDLTHDCASSTSRPSGSRRYAERPHG